MALKKTITMKCSSWKGGPGTQRGTGVHTSGAPGHNHPRVPQRMANTDQSSICVSSGLAPLLSVSRSVHGGEQPSAVAGFFFAADFTLILRVDNFFGLALVRMSAPSGG